MSKKALLGGLLPLMTNPGTMVIAAAGIVGLTVYGILTDNEKKENGSDTVPGGSEPYLEPLDDEIFAVEETVPVPLETVEWTADETVRSTDDEPYVLAVFDGYKDEDRKKEMIRQAMSELGKRSAAARARKKTNK